MFRAYKYTVICSLAVEKEGRWRRQGADMTRQKLIDTVPRVNVHAFNAAVLFDAFLVYNPSLQLCMCFRKLV